MLGEVILTTQIDVFSMSADCNYFALLSVIYNLQRQKADQGQERARIRHPGRLFFT